MQQSLGNFIYTLRQAGLPVSTNETLDAIQATQLLGVAQRPQLKLALGLILAKTEEHKERYNILFEQYFDAHTISGPEADEELSSGTVEPEQPDNNLPTALSAEPGEALVDTVVEHMPDPQSLLGQLLVQGNAGGLAAAIASAGAAEEVDQITALTQQSRYRFRMLQRLGLPALDRELEKLQSQRSLPAQTLRQRLLNEKQRLVDQVRDYVEQQYLLYARNHNLQQMELSLTQVKLSNIEAPHYHSMTQLVRSAAKLLASQHSRRRRENKRGQLDVRKTIAANAAFDGIQFRTRWKATRVDRPKVIAICDVSGSVSAFARFLLLFLYSLQDVMPRVRSFVFSFELNEVTECFQRQDLEAAINEVMTRRANRSTHYGRALEDFSAQMLERVDRDTTVIMLGDARNNHLPAREDIWEKVYRRSKRVLWLNPESRSSWDMGDSIMAKYRPYCSQVESCQSLRDLQRILGGLLKLS